MLEIPQGAGSGLIWDESGHIVTNYHVIRGASELQVCDHIHARQGCRGFVNMGANCSPAKAEFQNIPKPRWPGGGFEWCGEREWFVASFS